MGLGAQCQKKRIWNVLVKAVWALQEQTVFAHHTLTGGMKDKGDAWQGRIKSSNQLYVGLLPSQDIKEWCQQTCLYTLGKKPNQTKNPQPSLYERGEKDSIFCQPCPNLSVACSQTFINNISCILATLKVHLQFDGKKTWWLMASVESWHWPIDDKTWGLV